MPHFNFMLQLSKITQGVSKCIRAHEHTIRGWGPVRTHMDLCGLVRTCEDLQGPMRTCDDLWGQVKHGSCMSTPYLHMELRDQEFTLYLRSTCSSGWCKVISSSASLCAGSSHSSWISRSSLGTVSQRPQLAANWCTSSYWPGRAKLSLVCLPWVKHSFLLLQTVPWTPSQASPASGPRGSSLSPKRQLRSW